MPDVRLIDANALTKRIEESYCKDCDSYNGVMCRACAHMDDMDFIEDSTTVDAKPIIHAHWIMLDERVGQCSNCGYCQESNGIGKTGHGNIHKVVYKWCAVCGAYMGGDCYAAC